jgi:hypothetical protein
MLGLTSEDLQILSPGEKTVGTTSTKLAFASAGMTGDNFEHVYHSAESLKERENVEEVGVEEAVERCLKLFEESKTAGKLVEKTGELHIGGGVDSGI